MGCGQTKREGNQPIVPKNRGQVKAPSPIDLKPSASETILQQPSQKLKIDPTHFVIKNQGMISQNYTQSVKIGQGAHGFVRTAIHKVSGQKRAIKSIEKSNFDCEEKRSQFLNEVNILRIMDHPNVVKLYEFYEDDNYFHLVTEFMEGGELFDYIVRSKTLSEPVAVHFMNQVLSAVAYCHDNNIVHRDIKPENLLLDHSRPDAILKLIDFGTSAVMEPNKKLDQKCGNAFYIAPEILGKNGYNEKCDIWSCGVIMYILLSGKPPFYDKKDQDIIKKVLIGEYSVSGSEWDNVSSDAIRLLERMLELNPKRRISAKAALQDPWILNNITKSRRAGSEKSKTLINLALFHTEQKLQHAVLTFIASNVVSKELYKELLESFQKLDRNKDGKISAEELFQAYREKMKGEEAFEEVKKIMGALDLNQSGFIDYSEFITACLKKELLINNDTMDIAFKAFDIDGSGKITVNELKEVLGLIESPDENVAKLMKKVDENGDGNIDIREFRNMMTHCLSYVDDNVEIR